jgi:hypothetical protein
MGSLSAVVMLGALEDAAHACTHARRPPHHRTPHHGQLGDPVAAAASWSAERASRMNGDATVVRTFFTAAAMAGIMKDRHPPPKEHHP